MAKAILILVAVVAGGGLSYTSLQMSRQLKDQELAIERLRGQVSLLGSVETSETGGGQPALDSRSFDLPENSLANPENSIGDEELLALVARLVKDDAVVGAIARRVESQIDPSQALISSAAFKDGVKLTMEEIEEAEQAERAARRTEQMLARTEERAQELADKLNLPPATAEELKNIMIESAEARTDMMALMRTGELNRGDMREVMREQRDETNLMVQNILSAGEFEQYTKLQAENGGGRGGFGGFGGGGRRGGGGNNATTTNTPGGTTGGTTVTPVDNGGGRGGF